MKNLIVAFVCAVAVAFAGCKGSHHKSHRGSHHGTVVVGPAPKTLPPPVAKRIGWW